HQVPLESRQRERLVLQELEAGFYSNDAGFDDVYVFGQERALLGCCADRKGGNESQRGNKSCKPITRHVCGNSRAILGRHTKGCQSPVSGSVGSRQYAVGSLASCFGSKVSAFVVLNFVF